MAALAQATAGLSLDENGAELYNVEVLLHSASDLPVADFSIWGIGSGTSDPYVRCNLYNLTTSEPVLPPPNHKYQRSPTQWKNLNPKWSPPFQSRFEGITLEEIKNSKLTFIVMDYDKTTKNDYLGDSFYKMSNLFGSEGNESASEWQEKVTPLMDCSEAGGGKILAGTNLTISIRVVPLGTLAAVFLTSYEYQRWIPGSNWDNLLPVDSGRWSDETQDKWSSTVEELHSDILTEQVFVKRMQDGKHGWTLVSDNKLNAEGWEYSETSFTDKVWTRTKHSYSCVRRRKWVIEL